jgi:alginate O-acetyltransferase complex protein AlgF
MNKKTVTVLLCASSAMAQDAGLYAPAPPANSAFVRVLNISTAELGNTVLGAERGSASAYVVVPRGELSVKFGNIKNNFKVEAGKFYTAFRNGVKIVLLADPAVDNRAKALLTVYNLSKLTSVSLKTADGKTTVISDVSTGTSSSRAVNGITVDLAASTKNKILGTVNGVKLERGKAYAIVVTESGLTITTSTTKVKNGPS